MYIGHLLRHSSHLSGTNTLVIRHVTVLAVPRALGTSITLPIEMLNAANSINRVRGGGHPELNIEIASLDGRAVEITGGVQIRADRILESIRTTELVIIPALWGNPRSVIRRYPRVVTWLKQQYQQGALICATGTGCCFLAETGLLDGKAATTHWYYFDQFKKLYPKVHLQTKRFITNAGNLYCAGRINSITNLMIHFIERLFDHPTARQIELHFAHEIKPSYESIFYDFDEKNVHHDEVIIQVQQWMLRNYANEVKLHSLAHQFDMSLRTFNRRFKTATDSPPLQYLQQIRVGTAKDLLRDSNLSVAEISYRVGFNDPGYFAALFKKIVSISPRDYRRMVRAKLFSVDSG